jgi:hypothetical protein
MTSTCCSGFWCLLDLLKAMLHLETMRSLDTNTSIGTTSPMDDALALRGPLLVKRTLDVCASSRNLH